MPTPDCAIGVFLSLVIRESFQESTLEKKLLPPSSGKRFGRPAVWQSVTGRFSRASLRDALPRTPLRYALHTLPVFRPRKRS